MKLFTQDQKPVFKGKNWISPDVIVIDPDGHVSSDCSFVRREPSKKTALLLGPDAHAKECLLKTYRWAWADMDEAYHFVTHEGEQKYRRSVCNVLQMIHEGGLASLVKAQQLFYDIIIRCMDKGWSSETAAIIIYRWARIIGAKRLREIMMRSFLEAMYEVEESRGKVVLARYSRFGESDFPTGTFDTIEDAAMSMGWNE